MPSRPCRSSTRGDCRSSPSRVCVLHSLAGCCFISELTCCVQLAYDATVLLAKNGGFDELVQKPKKQGKKAAAADPVADGSDTAPTTAPREEDPERGGHDADGASTLATKRKKRVKPESDDKVDPDAAVAPRRSKRKTA